MLRSEEREKGREIKKERKGGRKVETEIELMYKETWREKENISFNTAAKRNITLSPLFRLTELNQ